MDLAIQALTIIATFSIAHERVIELLRWGIGKLPPALSTALDRATSGAWAWLPAIGLSLGTHANLLDAFRVGEDRQTVFFTTYLSGIPTDLQAIVGCCLMGLAVTLGSSFWHDLAQGLIDVRGRLKDVTPAAPLQVTAAVVVTPPTSPGQG